VEDITKEWTVEEEEKERKLFILHSLRIVAKRLRKWKMKGTCPFPPYVLEQMISIADYLHAEMNAQIPQQTIWLFLSFLLDQFQHLYNLKNVEFWREKENDEELIAFLNVYFGVATVSLKSVRFETLKKPPKILRAQMSSIVL
jgi:hypothetical protein